MAGRRGRPPLPRGVFSFEDTNPVPNEILLDTSFVLEALLRAQPLHAQCSAYLDRLVEAGPVVGFNRLLELELIETAFKLALVERYGNRGWRRARYDGRARRRAGRLMEEMRDAWATLLRSLNYLRIEVHEVADNAGPLMGAYGLASYDAIHVATALYAEIAAVVTLDTGFALVPEDSLLVLINSTRVGPCRRNRSR